MRNLDQKVFRIGLVTRRRATNSSELITKEFTEVSCGRNRELLNDFLPGNCPTVNSPCTSDFQESNRRAIAPSNLSRSYLPLNASGRSTVEISRFPFALLLVFLSIARFFLKSIPLPARSPALTNLTVISHPRVRHGAKFVPRATLSGKKRHPGEGESGKGKRGESCADAVGLKRCEGGWRSK